MDLLREFFRDKSAARLLMIAAALLLFVSQFFEYLDASDNSYMTFEPEFRGSTVYLDLSRRDASTGWEAHPHAWVILVVLAFALLREDIADTTLFRRFGYWVVFLLIIAAATPGAYLRSDGAKMGGIAILMALLAALMHQLGKKSVPAAQGTAR